MKLINSRIEINNAYHAIEEMRLSKSLDEFEKHWKGFLNYLEKSWNKAERECQVFRNKFEPWQGEFKKKRNSDQLLKYLKNARNADEHTIDEIVQKIPSKLLSAGFTNNGFNFIDKMVVKGGELIEYKGSPIDLIFSPAQLKVKSFRNSSIEYSVPQIHNYQRIQDPEDPICLAELGVKFYADFLDQIEGRF